MRLPVQGEGVHGVGRRSVVEGDEEVFRRQRLVIDRDAEEAGVRVVVRLQRDSRRGCLKRGLDRTTVVRVGLQLVHRLREVSIAARPGDDEG